MIAEVIVNHRAKSVDKMFDYLIPEELEGIVVVGSCVTVPFGTANKQKEAYVMAVKEETAAKKLKAIGRLSKEIRLFDEKQLELIRWMREKYLVTYLDAIHAIAPSGTTVSYEEWIVLSGKAERSDEIVAALLENGGACEINRLMGLFEGNIKKKLDALIKAGTIKSELRDSRTVKDKIVRMAEATCESEELSTVICALEKSNAFAQAKMLEILADCGRLSISDLVHFSGGSYSAVKALEKKGYIKTYDLAVMREVEEIGGGKKATIPQLTAEQNRVLSPLLETIEKKEYKPYLLHGVTGSGKTEVYMRAVSAAIEAGRKAIVLVPEISLTPQMVSRFKERFGKRVAIIHSGLSLGEKYDQWKKIRNGEADIAVGARSAIFAPFDDIGAIIVDEEHEQTYKSEMSPRYEVHDVAEFRARQYGALLVFASATPLVTSYYRAKMGSYTLLEMERRVTGKDMPEVLIADMREELEAGNKSVISRALAERIGENLKNKNQTILFLNRRGFSTFVSCRKCGYVAECPNCSISLKYHKYDNTLRCHYCGHTTKNYEKCPECGSPYIRYFGGGTQKVEEEIHKLFPDATAIRMDVDTTGKKNSHAQILNKFEKEKIDILIGTQMVTKGLDFPDVTLVGVISADTILNIDDYRSCERTFSSLEQVTGRAGRGDKKGVSVIQTYSPDNKAICLAKEHKYKEFYNEEIEVRRAMWYPPFCEMISVIFSGTNENVTAQCARFFAKNLAGAKDSGQRVQLLGPISAYISKIKGKYIYRLIIKCEDSTAMNEFLAYAQDKCRKNANYDNVTVIIDKNPNNT